MGHECKNTEVGVGRGAQVEVIPWTMGRGGVDGSMEFDRNQVHAAEYSKMRGKSLDLAAKRRSGEGLERVWKRCGKGWPNPRPGGRRGGRMLRFAGADTDSEYAEFRLLPQHG